MRFVFIVTCLWALMGGFALAEPPPAAAPCPTCDQSKAYPRPPVAATPEIAGWKIAGSHSVRGTLFIEFERTIPSGWEKMNVIVRKATTEEASGGDPAFERALYKAVVDNRSTAVGETTPQGESLTVATKRRDGSRGTAAVRIVTGSEGTPYIVSVTGEWPAGRQATFSKVVLALINGITVK